ncbi:Re/Si-specific NAD(P)(+) transhydrogenase subunit alpha [Salinibacter ruber]|uniref:Re/Si-specific NAD(P)(+) transhydrogenase subunit alpha n=1 Tax=Salinibacter ruber TaxID=146919 RepID=UPI001ABA341A|nr:Re/Si-specific NAD(P)(+) transhydrogenase subunit alpha [Salinibacter ruber]MCS3699356.1 NAD(P) transhydrogenase subunit alpha [Salinibacter ruber]MCS3783829.1 NAD(P) transhydrogenase subunit alpha [Salinibacter ruber]MCS4187915.1 NAD(P) transhydrogenase subunit alpha [Salinibacter ruber]
MALTIGVPRETEPGETRVALVPDVADRLLATVDDLDIRVEEGAGQGAYHTDADYDAAGCSVVGRDATFDADIIAKVAPPSDDEVDRLGEGQVLVGFLSPLERPETARALADRGVTALAMELVPRISRAQKLDALSAMSSIGGYRAAIGAAERLPAFFPLLTTAAGTVRPARVLVLGAGVAGLQAIATAKRLGAKVFGYDIREPTREEVESLGASFVELEVDIEADQDESGYAEQVEKEKQERQPELLQPHLAEADVVISTALIPGQPAPLLINEEAVAAMDPGSVIVDLAAPNGGNCALTETGEEIVAHNVQILGPTNLPAEMPVHASELYAKTVAAMIEEGLEADAFAPDFDDEIFAESCLTRDGTVQNDRVRGLLGTAEEAKA